MISIGLLIAYRIQMQELKKKMEYVISHATHKKLTAPTDYQATKEILGMMNEWFDTHARFQHNYQTKDQQLRDIVTSLSHDIRTPLTSLDGYFQLLNETESESERTRYSCIIEGRITSFREILYLLFMYMKVPDAAYQIELSE